MLKTEKRATTTSSDKWDRRINGRKREIRLEGMDKAAAFGSIRALKALAKAALDNNDVIADFACKRMEEIVKRHADHPEVFIVAESLLKTATNRHATSGQRVNAMFAYDSIVFSHAIAVGNGSAFANDAPVLILLLLSKNEIIKSCAVSTLKRINDERSKKPLERMLETTTDTTLIFEIEEALEELTKT